jgi:hypothetical protein
MSPEINSSIQTIILAVLTLITTVILPWLGKLVIAWFEAKTAKIKDDRARAAAEFALTRLDHIVTAVVAEINQSRPTGDILTKEQAKELLTRAYNRVKAQATDEIMESVKMVVRDPDRYTITKIEAAVGAAKDECK